VIIERFGVDQYGRQWHSFHPVWVAEREEAPLHDKSPTSGERR